MTGRDPAASRVALAAILVWVAVLTAVFLTVNAPWWFDFAAQRAGLPGLIDIGRVVRALFFRNYVF
jgi:hypothetical protein